MSFETMTSPEAVEAQQQTDSGNVAVSVEDWNSYKPSNPDSSQQTQDLVAQGTLPPLDFSVGESDTSGGMEYFNAADLDGSGEITAIEAATVYVSMDSDNSGFVSGSEFSGFFEESTGRGGGDISTTSGEKPEVESGDDDSSGAGEADFAADTTSSGASVYFDALDLDKDGQFSISEAVTAFVSMDSDNNGSVNGKEFSKFYKAVSDSRDAVIPAGGDGYEGGSDCEGCGDEGGSDCEGCGDEGGGGYEGGAEEGGGDCEGGGGHEGCGEEGGGSYEGGGGYEGGGYEGGGDAPPQHPPFEGGGPMEGGMGAVTIGGDGIPPELQKYAHMEGDILVIDAQGEQLPPLFISRDNVVIKNARINGAGADAGIHITGSHVQVLSSEITGGQAGITAERASDVTVDGNNIHDFEGGHAVVFNGVDGGAISNNKVSGYYPNDAINMLGSSNLKVMYNEIDVTVDGMGAPLMVEDGGFGFNTHSHDIEVAGNRITYGGGVPPGLLGGYNLSGHDNVVNGDTSAGAWQLYHYQSDDESFQSVWYNIYYNGQQFA